MSDLPPVTELALQQLTSDISNMRRGGSRAHPKPQKLLLLLAVLDMADKGFLDDNRISLNQVLVEHFETEFRTFATSDAWCLPAEPFFHLRDSGFWHHKAKPGREAAYAKLTTSGGGVRRVQANIEYAYLSNDAYAVVHNPLARLRLRDFITELLQSTTGPLDEGDETSYSKDEV